MGVIWDCSLLSHILKINLLLKHILGIILQLENNCSMDQPQLSHCFFQVFLEGNAGSDYQPILQILEARPLHTQGQKQIRARLCDGIFSYSGCVFIPSLVSKFENDQLTSHNGIIQVTKWKKSELSGKGNLNISDYKLITLDFPVIGNPQPHTGNPEEYRSQMHSYTNEVQQIQQPPPNKSSMDWNKTPTKEEPENSWSASTKRGRGASPSDLRQPLIKRQPDPVNHGMSNVVPISLITPYVNKWRICGIISMKDEKIKEISNARGNFRVFGFIITDQSGTSIRVSSFGEVADRVFKIVENGGVFYISGGTRSGTVKAANKQFNNTGHDYEITLDRECEVTYCNEQFAPPKLKLKPVLLLNVPKYDKQCIDVQAVVDRVADISQVLSRKDQQQLTKRDIFLMDKSATEIRYTLWGEDAMNFSVQQGIVIGIKGALVREFNGGFSLTSGSSAQIIENPDGDYTQELYTWYREQKPNVEIKTLSTGTDSSGAFERDFRLISQIMQHGLAPGNDKGQYFFIKAMVASVKTEQAIYQACPTKGCKKKMVMDGNNQFHCEKCGQDFDNCINVLMLQVELVDFTSPTWVTIFEENATTMLGFTADQLEHWRKNDPQQYNLAFNKIRFHEYIFRVRVRYETYNDNQVMKWTVYDVKPVPYDKCKQLYENTFKELQKLEQEEQRPNTNDSFYD